MMYTENHLTAVQLYHTAFQLYHEEKLRRAEQERLVRRAEQSQRRNRPPHSRIIWSAISLLKLLPR
jgi:hypothetical protein